MGGYCDWRDGDVTNDVLGIYLSEIKTIQRITLAEEQRLFELVLRGREASVSRDDEQVQTKIIAEGLEAEQKLVTAHLPMVVSLIKRFDQGASGEVLQDLVQAGNLGLVHAAKKFDPTRNARFSTCANWWIFKFVMDEYRYNKSPMRIPDSSMKKIRLKNKLWNGLLAELGREPTFYEIRDALARHHQMADNSEATKYLQMIYAAEDEVVSLDLPVGQDMATSLGDLIEERRFKGPEMMIDDLLLSEDIIKVLETLTEREKTVLTMLSGLKGIVSTHEEIAAELEINGRPDHRTEKVRVIEKSAIRKLRHPTRSRELRVYNELPSVGYDIG